MAMADDGRLIRNPVVVLREKFNGWALLCNPDNAQAVGMNPVGVTVWRMIDGRKNIKEIAETLGSNFVGRGA